MKKPPTTVKFYSDPGHGWLAVPIAEIKRLGIGGYISQYSAMKGGTAYLEEDCDAEHFLKARLARGEPVKTVEKWTNNRSPIRSYPRWENK